METRTRNGLIVYLVLTFALSSIFYVRSFSGAPLEQVTPLLMWVPAIAAIVTQLQGIFDRSTIDTGPTKWITTEFGIGLAIIAVVLGIYFWRRRGELRPESA